MKLKHNKTNLNTNWVDHLDAKIFNILIKARRVININLPTIEREFEDVQQIVIHLLNLKDVQQIVIHLLNLSWLGTKRMEIVKNMHQSFYLGSSLKIHHQFVQFLVADSLLDNPLILLIAVIRTKTFF